MKRATGGVGFLILFILLVGCDGEGTNRRLNPEKHFEQKNGPEEVMSRIDPQDSVKERRNVEVVAGGLVPADYYDHNIMISLRYATKDNFMHRVLYDTLKTAFLQDDVAQKLAKAQRTLTSIHPGYHLLVYDGLRPQSVQYEMWHALDTIPVAQRTKFVSNPKNGSLHNFGAAVDITITDDQGKVLDMGANYDDIREIAYPRYESRYLKSGELTEEHVFNRKLLRRVMSSGGFQNIATEWWHFNACSRSEARRKYTIVVSERIQ